LRPPSDLWPGGIRRSPGGAICGERNHERFNCEPLASNAHSRRQRSQQVQRLSALLGQALADLDRRSLQRGQGGLEGGERAGVRIVTCHVLMRSKFETLRVIFIARYRPGTCYSAPNICSGAASRMRSAIGQVGLHRRSHHGGRLLALHSHDPKSFFCGMAGTDANKSL
jgi:hypothetical protein